MRDRTEVRWRDPGGERSQVDGPMRSGRVSGLVERLEVEVLHGGGRRGVRWTTSTVARHATMEVMLRR
ncbi:hypothetical protein KI387_038425, partial [Taxus chinensis]